MVVMLPSEGGYENAIKPPGVDPAVHPYEVTAPAGGGIFDSLKPTAPIGTAAQQYQTSSPWDTQLDYKRRLLQSGRGVIDLSNPNSANNMGVYSAQQGVFGAQGEQNAAGRGVLDATGPYNQANRAVIGSEIANTNASIGENNALVAAQNDIADQSAVAQYNEYLGGRDRRNQLFGAAPEQRITVRPGQDFNLPSGQVAAPHTNADYVQEANQRATRSRGLLTDLLRGTASMAGADVNDARLKEGYAGANVADARLNASKVGAEASRSEQQVKYDDALLRNEAQMADLPPFPGAVQDDFTGEWITRQEQESRRYEHANQLEDQRLSGELQRKQFQQDQARQQEVQRTTGGSPFGALPDAAVLNQLESFNPGSFTAVREELIRRKLAQGYTQAQAEMYADNAIAAEMGSREQRPKATPSGGYTTIN